MRGGQGALSNRQVEMWEGVRTHTWASTIIEVRAEFMRKRCKGILSVHLNVM